jgi:signal transduction histidine kinase
VRGAGLGLAIAKHFVELQQGRIWVESVLGQGSRFYLTLPLAQRVNAELEAVTDRHWPV